MCDSTYNTGVYKITNMVNGKIYVGSAAVSFGSRFAAHLTALRDGKHHNQHLQRAYEKYGRRAFKFFILQRCPPELCLAVEQTWINKLNTTDRTIGYNIAPTAGSMLGYRHTDETKARISMITKSAMVRPDVVERVKLGQKRRTANPELSRRISDGTKLAVNRPEVLEKIRSHAATRRLPRPTKRPQAEKLPDPVVLEIKRLYRWRSSEFGSYGLARRFNTSQFVVMGIIRGRSYREVREKMVEGCLFD